MFNLFVIGGLHNLIDRLCQNATLCGNVYKDLVEIDFMETHVGLT